MSRRSRAREVALQVLFQDDLNPGGNPAEADLFLLRRLRGGEPGTTPPFATSAPAATPAPSGPTRNNPFGTAETATVSGAPTPAQTALIEFARMLVAGVRRN